MSHHEQNEPGLERVEHGGVTLWVIPMDSCLDRAQGFVDAGTPWHSHVLSPRCVHNPFPRHAILIEDDTRHRVFAASSEEFPEVDKSLVQMLHGHSVLDPERRRTVSEGGFESRSLDRARDLLARDQPWHHHMYFPACSFNPVPRRWTILVESGEEPVSESWPDEPLDVLRELEVLYFAERGLL